MGVGLTKERKGSAVQAITYGSERIDEPVESATVKRGDFNVKIDACADKASRRTGNKENMAEKRINSDVLPCERRARVSLASTPEPNFCFFLWTYALQSNPS
jgi:hypothetical protein